MPAFKRRTSAKMDYIIIIDNSGVLPSLLAAACNLSILLAIKGTFHIS
jgi:hypothetical protein